MQCPRALRPQSNTTARNFLSPLNLAAAGVAGGCKTRSLDIAHGLYAVSTSRMRGYPMGNLCTACHAVKTRKPGRNPGHRSTRVDSSSTPSPPPPSISSPPLERGHAQAARWSSSSSSSSSPPSYLPCSCPFSACSAPLPTCWRRRRLHIAARAVACQYGRLCSIANRSQSLCSYSSHGSRSSSNHSCSGTEAAKVRSSFTTTYPAARCTECESATACSAGYERATARRAECEHAVAQITARCEQAIA